VDLTDTAAREREDEARGAVSADRLRDHLVAFSRLFRDSGTEDERRAAAYLRQRLAEAGVAAQTLTFPSYISWPRAGTLAVLGPDGAEEAIPVRTRSFGGTTAPGGITAEVAFVPFSAPERGEMIFGHRAVAGEYAGLDIAGRVVLTADGGPDGIRRAQERAAAAHVHIWPSDEDAIHEMIASPVWGTPTPETAPRIPRIPALGLSSRPQRPLGFGR
jgi:hypothetical protein